MNLPSAHTSVLARESEVTEDDEGKSRGNRKKQWH